MLFQHKKNKKVRIALQTIFGIGPHKSHQICDALGLSNQYIKDLKPSHFDRIYSYIHHHYFFEHELKNIIQKDIQRLKDIQCFRTRKYGN